MSNKLPDKTNQDKKFGAKSASKTADSAASKKQGTGGEDSVKGRQTSNSKKTSSEGPVDEGDAGQFEDVDLSDPPREETEAEKSGFEMIDHADAPHSSRNEQADHKYKYPENFGKSSKKDSK